ncbi:MAG TPA: hypothetical protein VG869_00620 [Acidimicrobiia bacterium]|nr:hypothetical protein [Acidimicrobiia bacterium]
MRADLLERARAGLPRRLNAGILLGEGGCCVLGWMLLVAGYHEIALFGNTIGVVDPARGGPAPEVVAEAYEIPLADVQSLAQLNDRTPSADRVAAVAARLDELLARASAHP